MDKRERNLSECFPYFPFLFFLFPSREFSFLLFFILFFFYFFFFVLCLFNEKGGRERTGYF